MSKHQIIILLGVWVIIFPFLGFPFFLDKIIALITGILIISMVYSIRNEKSFSRKNSIESKNENISFVEHRVAPPHKINIDPTTVG